MKTQTTLGYDAFRDAAAEEVVGRSDLRIYSLSLSAQSSDSGEDCHAVAVIDADGKEHLLGEVMDSLTSDQMNAEIARRIDELGV